MAVAGLLCLDAGCRLLRASSAGAALQLALGLVVGALAHYRFAAVIGVGGLVLLSLPHGRAMLRDPRVWLAVGAGAVAWWPLRAWSLDYADAGARFRLVDRRPWSFHLDGIAFLPVQALLVAPLLLAALAHAAWRHWRDPDPVAAWLARNGASL